MLVKIPLKELHAEEYLPSAKVSKSVTWLSHSGVHSFLRLSWAWLSCYMWKHLMLLTYSNNYLNENLQLF